MVHWGTMPISADTRNRFLTALLELGLLAAFWYFLGLDEVLVGVIAAVIIVGAVVPPFIGRWVGGGGMLVCAGLAYFYYGSTVIAGLLGAFGVFSLVTAAMESSKRR